MRLLKASGRTGAWEGWQGCARRDAGRAPALWLLDVEASQAVGELGRVGAR